MNIRKQKLSFEALIISLLILIGVTAFAASDSCRCIGLEEFPESYPVVALIQSNALTGITLHENFD